jgi:hypothetical protein
MMRNVSELDSIERRALRERRKPTDVEWSARKSRFASFALVLGGCSDRGIEKPATTGTAKP